MLPTKDHDIIQMWAERYNAVPAERLPTRVDSEPAILTFLVGKDSAEPQVVAISWETFFAKFDLLDLSFAYDDDGSSQFGLVRVEKSTDSEIAH